MLNKFFEFCKKHIKLLSAILALIFLVPPVAVHLIAKTSFADSPLTSDGILSYIATFVSSILSALLVIYSVRSERMNIEIQLQKEKDERKSDIRPHFNIALNQDEGEYEMSITNTSNYPIYDLEFHSEYLEPVVPSRQIVKHRISQKKMYEICSELEAEFVNGIPNFLHIVCFDIDRHRYVLHYDIQEQIDGNYCYCESIVKSEYFDKE